MEHLTFRFAGEQDTELLLSFIRALAVYEKLEDKVEATPEVLRHWLFEEKKAEAVFALLGGREVGFMLFFYNFSTFLGCAGLYLEDLFVLPESRLRGVGRSMMQYLAGLARERGCGRLDWQCPDWNAPSIAFYRSLGARPVSGWTTYRLAGDELASLALK